MGHLTGRQTKQGNDVSRIAKYAAVVAVVAGLCACAQPQVKMVRPSTVQLKALEPLPVTMVIDQDKLAAQDTYSSANVMVMPGPGTPILAGAVGGALGVAIVDAAIRADARRFAETHVQPLQDALSGFDANGALDNSLQLALASQPALFGHFTRAGSTPHPGAGTVIDVSYAMTPDFSALQVAAKVAIHASDSADGKALYRNVLVYQSSRLAIPAKTAADVQRMVQAENLRYAALHVDQQIEQANAALENRDTETGRLREKIQSEQNEHRLRLKRAGEASWDPDTRAQRLCELWAANHGSALKEALRASGPEIAHMLQLDLDEQVPTGQAIQPHTVFKGGAREIDYLGQGQMISMGLSDGDASKQQARPTMFVPVMAPKTR